MHQRVCPGGILLQDFLNQADGFDKGLPVNFAELPQAGNTIADRELTQGQLPVELLNDFRGFPAGIFQLLFDPG
jgi:hypothetical protein